MNNRSLLFVCLSHFSQSWYRDAPLYPPSVCQFSRRSDMAFAFYSSFCKCAKRGRKIRRKKKQETKPIFGSRISRERLKRFRSNLACGVLKLEGVSTAKIVLFNQGSTELRRCENCVFFLPVNILTGVARRLLGPHDTIPCVLIWLVIGSYCHC